MTAALFVRKEQVCRPRGEGALLQVYATASENMDSLAFATPRLVCNSMRPAWQSVDCIEYDHTKAWLHITSVHSLPRLLHRPWVTCICIALQVLEGLKLSPDQFVDLCLLCGCDYLEPAGGVPPCGGMPAAFGLLSSNCMSWCRGVGARPWR